MMRLKPLVSEVPKQLMADQQIYHGVTSTIIPDDMASDYSILYEIDNKSSQTNISERMARPNQIYSGKYSLPDQAADKRPILGQLQLISDAESHLKSSL